AGDDLRPPRAHQTRDIGAAEARQFDRSVRTATRRECGLLTSPNGPEDSDDVQARGRSRSRTCARRSGFPPPPCAGGWRGAGRREGTLARAGPLWLVRATLWHVRARHIAGSRRVVAGMSPCSMKQFFALALIAGALMVTSPGQARMVASKSQCLASCGSAIST